MWYIKSESDRVYCGYDRKDYIIGIGFKYSTAYKRMNFYMILYRRIYHIMTNKRRKSNILMVPWLLCDQEGFI